MRILKRVITVCLYQRNHQVVSHVCRVSRLATCACRRYSSTADPIKVTTPNECISASDETTMLLMEKCMRVHNDFITMAEEQSMYDEVQPYLRRLRYEFDHWDDAIHGFRETERSQWKPENDGILQRVRDVAFPPGTPQLAHVHVLDLDQGGHIKPHIDSVRFCGDTITGLSLLSSSVMRLVHEKDKDKWADFLLSRRSLYIMTGPARYEYTHEILRQADAKFKGQPIDRERRISIICRSEPRPDSQNS